MRNKAVYSVFFTLSRTITVTLVAVGVIVGMSLPAVSAAAPSPASDDKAYVYWSFWTADGSGWSLSQIGPAQTQPSDGSVEGWRYGAGTATSVSQAPVVSPDFNTACANTAAQAGQIRIAVVVDSGSKAIAPEGQQPPGPVVRCAQVASGSNGLQVLSSVIAVRQDANGIVCGIDGYPAAGCSAQVSASALNAPDETPVTTPATTPAAATSGSSWLPFAGGIVLVVILVIGGIIIGRRRRA